MEGKKEKEGRVFENELFMLNKDWEFNDGDIETLYCLAMPMQRDLLTIRDLKMEHLPLLKSMRDESLKAIEAKFGVKAANVRSFFHY